MSEQEAKETACAIFGGNGDFYSFRKKAHHSTNETIVKKENTYEAAGFTESQINKIIETANRKTVQFKIGDKFYIYKEGETKIEDGLLYLRVYESPYDSVIIYPISMIYYIRVYDVKR